MKKILSLILALVLVMSLSVTAFAAETNDGKKDTTINVNAKYTDGVTEAGAVISVNVAWEAMQFTYTTGGVNTWNPATHKYEVKNSGGQWSATGNTVTVTNHSNVKINATLTFAADETNYPNLTGSFDTAVLKLDAPAENSDYNSAPSATAKLTLGGEIPSTVTDMKQVGTITVKITEQ